MDMNIDEALSMLYDMRKNIEKLEAFVDELNTEKTEDFLETIDVGKLEWELWRRGYDVEIEKRKVDKR